MCDDIIGGDCPILLNDIG